MYTDTRIHKIYTPLNLAVSVKTSGVPVAQVVNQFEETVTPERSESNPTILTPTVIATTDSNDGSWTDGSVVGKLVEVKWLANNHDISSNDGTTEGAAVYNAFHSAGSALFSIVSSTDDTNGSLRLWKNFAASERYGMQMSAKFVDTRTNRTYYVLTDAVEVYANSTGDVEWDFSIVHDVNVKYCPCYDRLMLYDYLVEKGIITASAETRLQYCDGNQYDLKLPIMITRGHKKYTADDTITFKLLHHISSKEHEEITLDNTVWLTEFTKELIHVDQRYLPDETVVVDVQMYVNSKFQSLEQITFSRWYPTIDVMTTNRADIDLASTTRYDKALVMFNGVKVQYPEAYLNLEWYAKALESGEWVAQGNGEEVTINQEALGISETGYDTLFVRLQYSMAASLYAVVNESGEYIVNESGQIIVNNYYHNED